MNKICTISDCDRKHRAKGLCAKHYYSAKGYGKGRGPGKKDYGHCSVSDCVEKAGPTGACRKHWHKVNRPNKAIDRKLKLFNISQQDYDLMLEKQGGLCKVCNTDKPGGRINLFAIDHDHSCCPEQGKSCGQCVRGLLCSRCNLTLGLIGDDVNLLNAMVLYLKG